MTIHIGFMTTNSRSDVAPIDTPPRKNPCRRLILCSTQAFRQQIICIHPMQFPYELSCPFGVSRQPDSAILTRVVPASTASKVMTTCVS